MSEPLYYISSPYGPCGNSCSWWAIDAHGYTADLNKAWKVSLIEALDIVRMKRGDKAWPADEIDRLAQRHVDVQEMRGVKSIDHECMSIPVKIDPTIPPDTIVFRKGGVEVGRIENVRPADSNENK